MQSKANTHIMKFVMNGKAVNTKTGKKCMPNQTYGVSQQSPDYFKSQNGLIGQNCYNYQHEYANNYEHFSQKKYFSIDGKQQENFITLYNSKVNNQLSFHRKKGRLSEFMDKNAWMRNVRPLMGSQRTPQSRELSNQQIKMKIKSLKHKKNYQISQYHKLDDSCYIRAVPSVMTQKRKIRLKRNQLFQIKSSLLAAKKFNTSIYKPNIQMKKQQIAMAMTAKGWNSTRSTFYKTIQADKPPNDLIYNDQDPQIWLRKTSRSKWEYKKLPNYENQQFTNQLNL